MRARRVRAKGRATEPSRAPGEFAVEIDAFIAFIDLERGLSRHTRTNYQSDLDQAADFFAKRGVANWMPFKVNGAVDA